MAGAMTDAAPATRLLKGGFDANLEFPLAEPYWAGLFKPAGCAEKVTGPAATGGGNPQASAYRMSSR